MRRWPCWLVAQYPFRERVCVVFPCLDSVEEFGVGEGGGVEHCTEFCGVKVNTCDAKFLTKSQLLIWAVACRWF